MVVERDVEEEMKEMCNIAEGLVDEALEEGIIKGMQKSIAIMRKTGLDDNSIIKLIADEYDKSENEVSKFM